MVLEGLTNQPPRASLARSNFSKTAQIHMETLLALWDMPRRTLPCDFGQTRLRTRRVRAKIVEWALVWALDPVNVNTEMWVLTKNYLILAPYNLTLILAYSAHMMSVRIKYFFDKFHFPMLRN